MNLLFELLWCLETFGHPKLRKASCDDDDDTEKRMMMMMKRRRMSRISMRVKKRMRWRSGIKCLCCCC